MPFSAISLCTSCGGKNRVPAGHLADVGRCGVCKAKLSPAREPIDVDLASFEEIIATAKVPVLVDFWAGWCGPCKMAAPEVRQLAAEMAGKALVLKVDTEAQPQLAGRFRVQSIPLFMVFRNGQPVFQQAGVVSRGQMRSWLEAHA